MALLPHPRPSHVCQANISTLFQRHQTTETGICHLATGRRHLNMPAEMALLYRHTPPWKSVLGAKRPPFVGASLKQAWPFRGEEYHIR